MGKAKICAYMFDCNIFEYKGRTITGLCYAIKTNQIENEDKVYENVKILLSKETGFDIVINFKGNDLSIEPYQTYFLAQCENGEEDPLEVTPEVLMQYSDYIIGGESIGPESSWVVDES